jgi:hypothetical protein
MNFPVSMGSKIKGYLFRYLRIILKWPLIREGEYMALAPGQPAPDFSLKSHTGTTVKLSDYRGKNVVLAFFPLAWTPV